ncbi:hypothetical protein F511_31498 [Dorcoceras hygrometricum]|uniref:Uncharacterized protein n=1 Tax=Dorcoceras hygrometricum TaxID=472368 RepID=A0A2Z7D0C0_9LAMI|nr:hypothetical protein F511_31498 [Dorcoceras hygrometricum]
MSFELVEICSVLERDLLQDLFASGNTSIDGLSVVDTVSSAVSSFGLVKRGIGLRIEYPVSILRIFFPIAKSYRDTLDTVHRTLSSSSADGSQLRREASMAFRVVRTNQYNQDLGLIHSTNGNHLESPNEGSSIDHQVTIHLHAQNITMFPTNETWYFASQMLVSSSGGLILILTAQSTRNEFRIHSDY